VTPRVWLSTRYVSFLTRHVYMIHHLRAYYGNGLL